MTLRCAMVTVLVLAVAACAEKGPAPVDRQAKRLESSTYGWVPAGLADRSDHAMAELGGKVYLFGGYDLYGASSRNDFWAWDGKGWTQVATPLRPSARLGHRMATHGSRIVLFGGEGRDGQGMLRSLDDTWEFDGSQWRERHPKTRPPARAFFAMAATTQGVTLYGGVARNADAVLLQDTWTWDGSDWTHVPTAHVPASRAFSPSMASDGGRLVLTSAEVPTGTWVFDGSDWISAGVLGPQGATASLDGSVYAVGEKTWRWDGTAWLDLGATPDGGWDLGVAPWGDRLVRYGGRRADKDGADEWFTTTWGFDGTTWSVLAGPSAPRSRIDHATATSAGGQVFVFGGMTDAVTYAALDDLWAWDGARWSALSSFSRPPPTRHPVMATYGGGALLLSLAETWEWSGTDWTRRSASGAPTAFGTMAHAGDRAYYLDLLGMMWEWDGATWTKKTESGDAISGSIAEHGGKVVAYDHSDLLEWDGAGWQRRPTTGGPSSLSELASLGDRLVGLEETPASRGPKTWELIGTTWSENAKAGFIGYSSRPMARHGNALVLFGAAGDSGAASSTFVYRKLLARGSNCTFDEECEDRACVDGICCDGPCNGQCESCAAPGSVGRCTAVKGSPMGGRETCEGEGPCGASCNGVERETCVFPGTERSCSGGRCAMRISWPAAKCDGKGSCVPADPVSIECAPYDCAGEVCATSCAQEADCITGYRCQDSKCVARLATGEVCTAGALCATGNCVHGRCCESRCAGQCQACDVAGQEGRCLTIDGPPREDRAACDNEGVCREGKCEDKPVLTGGSCSCGSIGGALPVFALLLALSALSRGARSRWRSSPPPPTAG